MGGKQEKPPCSRVRIVAQATWQNNAFTATGLVEPTSVRLWVTEDGAAYYGRGVNQDVWRLPVQETQKDPNLTLRGCADDIAVFGGNQLPDDQARAWLRRSEAFARGVRGWSGDPELAYWEHLQFVLIPTTQGGDRTHHGNPPTPLDMWPWETKLLDVPLNRAIFGPYMDNHDPWRAWRPVGARAAIPANTTPASDPQYLIEIERLRREIIEKGHDSEIARAEARRFAIEARLIPEGLTGQDALRTIDTLGKTALERLAHHF